MQHRRLIGATLAAGFVTTGAAGARGQDPIVRASLRWDGGEANSSSGTARRGGAISADGRYVVFASDATNLVPDDTNGLEDVFVRDLWNGATVRMNVSATGEQADGGLYLQPVISENGRFVAFTSSADNLVPNDTNHGDDIFVHDRDPDSNGIFDEGYGAMERASVASDGTEANGGSQEPTLSADGNVVAFLSYATNLIAIDRNGKVDIFVHNRATGVTQRASRNNANAGANGDSFQPQISADGGTVVFQSFASNLDGPNTTYAKIYVRDLVHNVTQLVSTATNGDVANDPSDSPTISADGRFVCFRSDASNLFPEDDPSNASDDVFVKDRTTGVLDCMTIGPSGLGGHSAVWCTISSDATKVMFSSGDTIWAPYDTNNARDVFVRDVASKSIVCASVNCLGIPAATPDDSNFNVALSADGRFAVFSSFSPELVDDDTNGFEDVFANDLTNSGFQAYWTNYGDSWPGTNGVPAFTASADPEFGATIELDAANSLGNDTLGFLFVGFGEASLSTNRGGTIVVDAVVTEALFVPASGWSEPADIPLDTAFCGMEADLQLLELDGGASKGYSFTPGLKLVFGR